MHVKLRGRIDKNFTLLTGNHLRENRYVISHYIETQTCSKKNIQNDKKRYQKAGTKQNEMKTKRKKRRKRKNLLLNNTETPEEEENTATIGVKARKKKKKEVITVKSLAYANCPRGGAVKLVSVIYPDLMQGGSSELLKFCPGGGCCAISLGHISWPFAGRLVRREASIECVSHLVFFI